MIRTSLILVLLSLAPAHADDFDTIRQNFVRFHAAPEEPRGQPVVRDSVARLGRDAANALSSQQSDGRWTDVNYGEVPGGGWSMETHYRRALTLARAFRTPGQPYYNRADVRQAVERALSYANRYVYAGVSISGNWWHWEVTVPYVTLGPTLLLMQGQMSASVFNAQVETMRYLVGKDLRGGGYSGQNRAWKGMTRLFLGVLRKDPAMLAMAREDIAAVCRLTTGDGIQPDYSFHQHGPLLATAAYGGDFAETVGLYFVFTEGTGQRPPPEALTAWSHFVAEGIRWALYHNYFDLHTQGRNITRQNANGRLGLYALLLAGSFTHDRREDCVAAARKMLETYTASLPVSYAGLATRAAASPVPAAWPSGTNVYPQSDFVIHRRPGWFFSMKMLSARTINAELVNNEGKRSWHLGDGAMYLVRDGDEYLDDNVLPTLDWTRLPGITVERKPRAPKEGYGRGSRVFVGGASTGANGVAAMDFDANASPLTARRSWFFFDDEIVFIGDAIRCASGNPVETIVNQWPLESASAPIVSNGRALSTPLGSDVVVDAPRWMQSAEIGYYFPTRSPVRVRRETRTGRWSDLGAGGSSTYSHTFLQIRRVHGSNPTDGRYAYAIVPGASPEAMAAYAAAPPVQILSDEGPIHAVRHTGIGAVGAVFWQAGSIDRISVNRPCVVFYRLERGHLTIAVADPAQTGADIQVTFDTELRALALPPGMTVAPAENRTVLTVRPLGGGRSYSARFGTQDYTGTDFLSEGAGVAEVTVIRPGTEAVLRYDSPDGGGAHVRVFSRTGDLVLETSDAGGGAGPNVFRWNGRNAEGSFVASGIYQVLIEAGGKVHRRKVAVVK